MHIIKVICLTVVELAKQIWAFPATMAANFRKKGVPVKTDAAEAERLDRIRHPSKYLGKEN